MTDEALMLCVKNDDLDKSAILYERYKKKLNNFFMYRNSFDKEASEDCIQQVFYRVIKYRKSYKADNNFSKWIFTIAKNILFHDSKEQLKVNHMRANYHVAEEYNDKSDDYQAIRQAVLLLPEQYREVLLMSKFMDMKYEDIAEISECSIGTIKIRVYRAIKILRETYLRIS
jgi:RNA polymerase sigma factor (sigma-70 family)